MLSRLTISAFRLFLERDESWRPHPARSAAPPPGLAAWRCRRPAALGVAGWGVAAGSPADGTGPGSTLHLRRQSPIIVPVTKEDLIRRLKGLSKGRFAEVAPFIEADLEAADDLAALRKEIRAGRRSAAAQPLLEAQAVYDRVRQALAK